MKMTKALAVALAVAGASMAMPAMADPDLEGAIQAISCPDPMLAGSVTVLGITVAVPFGTPFTAGGKPVDCAKLVMGDRIKVSCADATCAMAAAIKFDPNSAESSLAFEGVAPPVPAVNGSCTDAVPPDPLRFMLSSGVVCTLDPAAEVKQDKKKNFIGALDPANPTQAELFYFLACSTPGTPGTNEIKCSGYNPLGDPGGTTKVDVKK